MTNKAKFTISAEDRFSGAFSKLKRDISASKGELEGLAGVASTVNAALGRIAFGSVVGAAGFAAGVVQIARSLDDLNDVSAATGATVERLSALDRVARENGGNLDTVSTSLLRLNTVLREAKPDSPGARALEAIGLSAKQLRKLDPADALKKVADALAQYADDGNKARILQELLGKSTKETAGFLKDLAESGQLNARVTTEQAQAAEKFVKNLNELKANAEDAGRSLANVLIPSVNDLVRRMTIAREVFGSLGSALLAGTGVEDAAQGLDLVTKKLADLRKEQKQLADSSASGNKGGFMSFLFGSRSDEQIAAEIAKAEKLQGFYERVLGAQKQFAGGGRGFVNPDAAVLQPRLPDIGGKDNTKDRTSEAERFLESLQRRIQAEQKLTNEEQARLAIERGLDGLTPAVQAKIIAAARFADALDDVNKALEQQKNFEDLLAKKRQEDITSVQRLLEATPTGQRQKLVIQGELVLDFARRNAGDDQIQKQAKEALEKLNAEMRKIGEAAEAPQSQFEKLADTIQKTMERSTDAVLDFVVEGKGGMGSLVRAFGRDILRQQIEAPIRDTFKGVSDVIRKSLEGLGSGDFLSGIADFFKKLFGGGGGGILGAIGGLFGGGGLESGGFTGRASGGGVKAGQLVRWQENGREWFVPSTDGTVVKGAASGGNYTFAPVVNVNGDVGPQTVALVQAMLAKQQSQWMRSMRTGGAMSAA